MRSIGARQGSTPRLTFRKRLAAGAALCIATTTAAVVGASVPALADVSGITVTPSRTAAGALSNYTIPFTTAVALVLDTDSITLVGPAGTVFPLVAADYTVNATASTATPTHPAGTNTVTFVTHVGAATGTVTVVAKGVTNPAAGSPTLTVQTSKEATPVASSSYNITAATAVGAVVVSTVSPAKVSATNALYAVHFTVATLLTANFDTITLSAPSGTVFPLVPGNYLVTAGGTQTTENAVPTQTAPNNITLNVPPGSTGAGTPLFVNATGVTNPSTASATETLTVATSADTTPTTSANYTVGPLTAVTGVTVAPSPALAGATSNYTLGFTAATALVADNDTITIVGPTGTVFPAGAGAYAVNSVTLTAAPTVTAGNVTMTVHSAISAGAVPIVITGVINPVSGSKTLTLATSEDATAATSSAYVITSAVTGTPSVTTAPNIANATSMYTVGFFATSALTGGTGTITIVGATGTAYPLVATDYTVNGSAVTATPTGTSGNVTLVTPVSVGAAGAVTVVALGVTNPGAGSKQLTVATSADVSAVTSASYTIAGTSGTQVTAVTVTPSPTTTGASASYTVGFHVTTTVAGGGTITIVGPTGTVFPATASSYTINGTVAASATGGGTTAVLHSTSAVTAGTTATVVATGVTNPAAGNVALTVATSGDVNAAASSFYAITAASGGGGGGGTGGTTSTGPATPVRLSGTDRFGTAIAASVVEFPSPGTAGAVVLARADDYPDALVGTALAAAKNAPLLFANGGALTAATQAEIQRVLPAGGTVYLLGGTTAIPTSVATTLTGLGFVPVRYAGTDRFGTALAVADALGDPSTVLLATGINFPDALAAGPAAAHTNGVVLLTNGSALTPAVTAYLAAHPGTVYAIGGPAVAADPSATALSGTDRYATAALVASSLFASPVNVGLASGTAFPDALSGGAFQAHFGGPIVLSDPRVLPASTSAYLTATDGTIATTNIFGGTNALSTTVQTAIGTALGL